MNLVLVSNSRDKRQQLETSFITTFQINPNYGNAIYPKSYVGDVEDDELLRLSKYLSSIKDCENFRKIEKRNWRTQHNN